MSSYAFAEGPSREELLFLDIPIVITATKTEQPLPKAPATVIVLSKRDIKERGYNNLLDLLKDIPGIDVQDRCCQEVYNTITMRGIYKQEKLIIMMDGHRISSPTGEKIPIAENFPLYNAKQVEIVYGPASALYGADAFAGVINIITDDADEINGLTITASAGNFGYTSNTLYYGDRLSDNVKLSLGGHLHDADNAELPKYYSEYTLGDLAFQNTSTAAVAGNRNFDVPTKSYSAYMKIDLKDNFVLGFNRSFFRHPSGQGDLPTQTFFDENVKWETLVNNYYADYSFKDGDNVSGTTSLSYLTYEVLPGTKFKDKWDNYSDAYKYANGKRFKLEQQLNVRKDNHNLVAGASFEDFYSLPKTFNLNKPFDQDRAASEQNYFYEGSNNTIPLKIYELKYSNYGTYLQLQSDISSSVSTTIGARFDHNSRYGNTFNPRGGIVFSPEKDTTIKLLYGEAFNAPSPYTAYGGYGTFDGDPDNDGIYENVGTFRLPNPDLKPEELKTYEVSLLQKVSPNFKFSASAYYTDLENLITNTQYKAPTPPSTYIAGSEIGKWNVYENRGEAYFYGGELSADYTRTAGGATYKYWGNYSYVDGRQKQEGSPWTKQQSIAKHKLKTGVTVTYGNIYITPSAKWIGRTNNRLVLRTTGSYSKDELSVDDYTLFNLHMGVNNLINSMSASLNIQNLTDKRYYNNGEASSRFDSVPQDPRRIVLSLDYKF